MAAPDLAILLVHTGQSSSLIGQNTEADTVPACLLEMNHHVAYNWKLFCVCDYIVKLLQKGLGMGMVMEMGR